MVTTMSSIFRRSSALSPKRCIFSQKVGVVRTLLGSLTGRCLLTQVRSPPTKSITSISSLIIILMIVSIVKISRMVMTKEIQ